MSAFDMSGHLRCSTGVRFTPENRHWGRAADWLFASNLLR